MGKNSSKPPPAPDPVALANSQADANIRTAQEQQRLNLVNQVGPNGSVTWAADPNAPGGFTQTTALSPGQQGIYDALQTLTGQQLGALGGTLGQGFDTRGLPGLQTGADLSNLKPGEGVLRDFDTGPDLRYSFNPGQQVQGQVGGDLDAVRQQAIDAAYQGARSRLDPFWMEQENRLDSKLANQGFAMTSDGARYARSDLGRDRNDAYDLAGWNAVAAGEDAANAMFGRQLAQGQFANQAAGQQFGQNMMEAGFFNSAAGQQYDQNLGSAQFNNQGQQQSFGQQRDVAQLAQANAQINNAARSQGFNERMAQYQLPLQTAAGLMGLQGAVQMPSGFGYSPSQVGQTDVLGANALSQQAQWNTYNAQQQQQQGLMSGLFQLGAAAIPFLPFSDFRLKRDIEGTGVSLNGHPLYRYRYIDNDRPRIGVIAQEVAAVNPAAVHDVSGFLAVDYEAL